MNYSGLLTFIRILVVDRQLKVCPITELVSRDNFSLEFED